MKRPWMPLYVADYLADTVHLTTAEHGAYLLLLMYYWTHGTLPADENAIRRITKLSEANWKRSGKTVLDFFPCVYDTRRNKRADQELAKAIEKSSVNSANAKRKHSDRSANAYTLTKKERKLASFGKDSERLPPVENPAAVSAELAAIVSQKLAVPAQGQPATALVGSAPSGLATTPAKQPPESQQASKKAAAETASKPNGSNPERKFTPAEIGKPNGWDWDKRPDGGFYAALDSPEQRAWEDYRGTARRDEAGGWTYPAQWPPNAKPPAIAATA